MHSADVRVESFDRLCHSEVAKDLLLIVMQADASAFELRMTEKSDCAYRQRTVT